MSLYGPTLHATTIDLSMALKCKINKSCIMNYGNKNCVNLYNKISVVWRIT